MQSSCLPKRWAKASSYLSLWMDGDLCKVVMMGGLLCLDAQLARSP